MLFERLTSIQFLCKANDSVDSLKAKRRMKFLAVGIFQFEIAGKSPGGLFLLKPVSKGINKQKSRKKAAEAK